GTQWFERTLDDSANKRIAVAEGFLAADAILNIMMNVTSGMVVYPAVIRQRVMNELPFMATENVIMDAAARGGDRQELHEHIRVHSMAAGAEVKQKGLKNDLCERIVQDPIFGVTAEELESKLDPANYTGRSVQQVEEFLAEFIAPVLKDAESSADVELTV
ncbi:MAG: adenylosuccinate lyase, partial [Oscillospiraceae bacterium]|nr:adenylosuccinate lyase [Oscillospiraceae bacterium]